MGHLAATETHGHLHTVAFLEELHRAAHLGIEVIGIDAGRHTDLFDLHDTLVLLGFLFLLELVKTEFTVIQDLANRGNRIGRDLDQVKLLLLGHAERLRRGDNTHHDAVGANEADFLIPDFFIELMI